jgi:hypothetical protein
MGDERRGDVRARGAGEPRLPLLCAPCRGDERPGEAPPPPPTPPPPEPPFTTPGSSMRNERSAMPMRSACLSCCAAGIAASFTFVCPFALLLESHK